MSRRVIGTIVPSSNRTVERTLAAIMPAFPQVDSCVARIPYWGNGLGQPAAGYDTASYRDAGRMLGHAGAEVVFWNGSKDAASGWLWIRPWRICSPKPPAVRVPRPCWRPRPYWPG